MRRNDTTKRLVRDWNQLTYKHANTDRPTSSWRLPTEAGQRRYLYSRCSRSGTSSLQAAVSTSTRGNPSNSCTSATSCTRRVSSRRPLLWRKIVLEDGGTVRCSIFWLAQSSRVLSTSGLTLGWPSAE